MKVSTMVLVLVGLGLAGGPVLVEPAAGAVDRVAVGAAVNPPSGFEPVELNPQPLPPGASDNRTR